MPSAVSEHAIALILALTRRLPEARDNQNRKFWRGMLGDLTRREDELGGKTLLIVGLGRIGGRLARLAKAFDMHVIGLRRDPAAGRNGTDEVHGVEHLHELLPRADIVALTCPLTPQTENLIDANALRLMKPSAHLVNCARGRVVDEAALIACMQTNGIAAAGIDVTTEEPLPAILAPVDPAERPGDPPYRRRNASLRRQRPGPADGKPRPPRARGNRAARIRSCEGRKTGAPPSPLHHPLNRGVRFSRKALLPSWKSSLSKQASMMASIAGAVAFAFVLGRFVHRQLHRVHR